MFLLFFFFKQKTAYERRISDWSSDVCSSDLDPAPGRLGSQARDHVDDLARALVLERPLDEVEARPDDAQLGVEELLRLHQDVLPHPDLADVVEDGREIGRESCRERVWQYV